jgi:predicted nucleotidyltransferase
MQPEDTIAVSELARRTRAVVERLAREPGTRLVVMKNNRPVAVIAGVERGAPAARGTRAGAREEVLRRKTLIGALARAHGARTVRLIGSAARGEERPDSDIDFLVELEPGRSLLDLIGLENDLADLFGRKVEVVPMQSAKPRVLASSLKDAIRIV